jgi:type I restriction enzyme, S subunit
LQIANPDPSYHSENNFVNSPLEKMIGKSLNTGGAIVFFGDVVRNVDESIRNPQTCGLERYVGLEHIDPESLHIQRWGLIAEGTSFTRRFRKGQVLFGKRRAYQRKVAVANFDGLCSSDILVFEPKDNRLLPELLPFICQSDGFFEHALNTSAGSLSPRTNVTFAQSVQESWKTAKNNLDEPGWLKPETEAIYLPANWRG